MKPSEQRRRKIVDEIAKKDKEKKKNKRKGKAGEALRQVNGETKDKSQLPGSAYRNPKVTVRVTTCCLDKDRPLPMSFKVCVDCPGSQKLTEVGPESDEASVLTEAG